MPFGRAPLATDGKSSRTAVLKLGISYALPEYVDALTKHKRKGLSITWSEHTSLMWQCELSVLWNKTWRFEPLNKQSKWVFNNLAERNSLSSSSDAEPWPDLLGMNGTNPCSVADPGLSCGR